MRTILLAACGALLALAGSGCKDDCDNGSGACGVTLPYDIAVPRDMLRINDLAITSAGVVMVGPGGANVFSPATVTIQAGQSVTWDWVTGTHSIVSDDTPAAFTPSSPQAAGQYTVTFPTAGTYGYHCGVHGSMMTGTVLVQ